MNTSRFINRPNVSVTSADVQVAEADRQETDQQADRTGDGAAHDDREQDRHAPVVHEPRTAEAADAGKGDLTEPGMPLSPVTSVNDKNTMASDAAAELRRARTA